MTSISLITRSAQRLDSARRSSIAIAPVRHELGDSDVAVAYAVQSELTARRVSAGGRVVGRKIGLTSPVVQAQLGVDQPDFGVLFDDMAHATGDTVQIESLLQPKVEAEVAFVLAADLEGDVTAETVRASVGYMVSALEVVDSRIADWDISIVDTVADNGSSALFVLGDRQVPLSDLEPRDVEMTMRIDGEVRSTGEGVACLGDPLNALLWLARTAQELGDPLRAGEVILSGALGPMVPISADQTVTAEISGLGTVTAVLRAGEEA